MVMAGVAISEDKLEKLKNLGVKDSKLLTPKKREELFEQIISLVDAHEINITEPQEIDSRKAVGTNLNQLEAIKAAEIISALSPDKVIIDSPDPIASRFGDVISGLTNGTEVLAEHKADVNYPVCSAASILAKVTRDRLVREIEKEIGYPIGSGYQSDPICRSFLDNHYKSEHEKFLRKSWSTFKNLKSKKEQVSLGDF